MASETTMTSSTVSETKSTTTVTTWTAASSTTDSSVQKETDETATITSSTRMTTDTAIATTSHYHHHQKQDESQQNAAIQTWQELLALPSSMELCQTELIYRAEGNANLVLALPQFKKVLRLPKSAIASSSSSDEQPQKERASEVKEQQSHKQAQKASATAIAAIPRETLKVDLTMKDFATYMQISQQLLGSDFVLEADICWIASEADRKWLNKHISSARPPHRRDKEFCGQFGLLLPDATQLPVLPSTIRPTLSQQQQPSMQIAADILHSNFQSLEKLNKEKDPASTLDSSTTTDDNEWKNSTYAIEIKPKQGWLLLPNPNETSHVNVNDLFDIRQPTKTAIATETTVISSAPTAAKVAKTTFVARCRYCAMQFLKLKNHKISKQSSYCPIELFSGVPSRMLNALDALFRCPQNNLRVFKNGILIYGDHASSISYKQLDDDVFKDDTLQLVKNLLVECLLRDYSNKAIETLTSTFSDKMGAKVVAVGAAAGQPHSSVEAEKVESSKDQTTKIAKSKTQTPTKTTETETKASNSKKKQEAQATLAVEMKMEKLTPAALGGTTQTTNLTSTIASKAETTATTTTSPAQVNEAEIQCLPKNCILQKILHLQLLVKHNLAFMHQAGFVSYTQKSYKALDSLLKKTMPISFESLAPSEQYLLGATALDCSIMVAFQKCNENEGKWPRAHVVRLPNSEFSFLTKVTILDLDPKPDSHFSKYVQQTKDAYAALYSQ